MQPMKFYIVSRGRVRIVDGRGLAETAGARR
jgi:hypothetical protein